MAGLAPSAANCVIVEAFAYLATDNGRSHMSSMESAFLLLTLVCFAGFMGALIYGSIRSGRHD